MAFKTFFSHRNASSYFCLVQFLVPLAHKFIAIVFSAEIRHVKGPSYDTFYILLLCGSVVDVHKGHRTKECTPQILKGPFVFLTKSSIVPLEFLVLSLLLGHLSVFQRVSDYEKSLQNFLWIIRVPGS